MDYKVITKEKARNYLTTIVRSFKILNEHASKDGITLELNKHRLSVIIKKYDEMLYCLKSYTMQMNSNGHVDSHKISAIFLVSILLHKDIIISENNDISALSVYPHIYIAFILGNVIMEDMYNEANSSAERLVYNVNMNYAKEFVKLIYANEKAILKPAESITCNDSFKGMFFLSHLFYFIEQVADKQAD